MRALLYCAAGLTEEPVKWFAIGVCLAGAAFSNASEQSTVPEWVLQLSRVKHHLKENFERIPNHVCSQTVERFEKRPGHAQFAQLDTLRFDVAYVQNKELLARPSDSGFEDRDISAYMSRGMLGTGAFSTVTTALFVADNGRIVSHRQAGSLPHSQTSYDYEIPQFLSGFEIATNRAKAVVGVRGTFWVDAESLDLTRIEEHAVDLPMTLEMSEVVTTVSYDRVRIGSSSVLLPQFAELAVSNRNGSERLNKTTYSECRQYGSESTVRFEDSVPPPPVVKK